MCELFPEMAILAAELISYLGEYDLLNTGTSDMDLLRQSRDRYSGISRVSSGEH